MTMTTMIMKTKFRVSHQHLNLNSIFKDRVISFSICDHDNDYDYR